MTDRPPELDHLLDFVTASIELQWKTSHRLTDADLTRIKEIAMSDTTTDAVLEGAAPYDPDQAGADALRCMAEGLRRAATHLVSTNPQAAAWLTYAADGAADLVDIVAEYDTNDGGADDD